MHKKGTSGTGPAAASTGLKEGDERDGRGEGREGRGAGPAVTQSAFVIAHTDTHTGREEEPTATDPS